MLLRPWRVWNSSLAFCLPFLYSSCMQKKKNSAREYSTLQQWHNSSNNNYYLLTDAFIPAWWCQHAVKLDLPTPNQWMPLLAIWLFRSIGHSAGFRSPRANESGESRPSINKSTVGRLCSELTTRVSRANYEFRSFLGDLLAFNRHPGHRCNRVNSPIEQSAPINMQIFAVDRSEGGTEGRRVW